MAGREQLETEGMTYDAIGVSFPDVVIRNRIVGGETQKTYGFHRSPDYEGEFKKLGDLGRVLGELVCPGGEVSLCNDGAMAAFTAAVEHAVMEETQEETETPDQDYLCFSLGTDLGTGWVTGEGMVPAYPLEAYRLIVDLGSYRAATYPPEDVRSIRDAWGMPGCIGRYTSQSAIFRYAAMNHKNNQEDNTFTEERDGVLFIPPEKRKKALDHHMARAQEDPGGPLGEAFYQVGVALAMAYQELKLYLSPDTRRISLFGRLVKREVCQELIRRGVKSILPELEAEMADEGLAESPLMGELSRNPDITLAQFAQAVGAIYYAVASVK